MKRPLGHFEQALTLTGELGPFSVVGVLRLLNGPTPEKVRQVLDQLQLEQPLLNVSITTHGKKTYFEMAGDAPPIGLQILPWEDDTQWQTIAAAALNTAIDIHTAPLMRCIYLYQAGGNTAADLVFVYHHAIMDAASTVQFYQRLLSLCGGGEVEEPGMMHTLLPATDGLMPPPMQGLKRNGRLLRYLAAQMVDELQYRRQLGQSRVAPLHKKLARNLMVTRKLDKATTRALVRRSRQERVSMNSIVSAALLLAVHKHLYHNQPLPLRPLTFANLRPYLTPPVPNSYFGCYIALLRFTLFCEENGDFWQTARRFQEAVTRSSKQGEWFPAMLMSIRLMQAIVRFEAFRMGTTAVSYAGPLQVQPVYGPIQLRNVHGFIANNRLGAEFTAFAKILFGELSWDFLYIDADMDQALANTIADEVVAILQTSFDGKR